MLSDLTQRRVRFFDGLGGVFAGVELTRHAVGERTQGLGEAPARVLHRVAPPVVLALDRGEGLVKLGELVVDGLQRRVGPCRKLGPPSVPKAAQCGHESI